MSEKAFTNADGEAPAPSDATDALVELDELKTYYRAGGLLGGKPVKAVDGVSFDIRRGETLGLVGESGCGKTTLGRTLVQLESVTDGSVTYDGTDITSLEGDELKVWRRNVQMVFQDPDSSLNDRMTVGEIVREPLDVHDWPNLTADVVVDDGVAVTVEGDMLTSETKWSGDVDLLVHPKGADATVEVRENLPLSADDVTASVRRNETTATVTVEDGRAETTVSVNGDEVPVTVEASSTGDEVDVTNATVGERSVQPLSVDGRDVTLPVETVTASIAVSRSKKQLRRRRVRNLLEEVGLQEEHYYRYPHQFSGGQRQRIGIARALALEPEFVVLDEPVSALDASVQAKILNLLEDLQTEFGLTYLFIAHDLAVVRHICDRVAVMYLGHVMELGDTEVLFQDPTNPYTLSLLSAIPEPDPRSAQERITLRGTPPSPTDPPEGCPFATRCPMKIRPAEHRDLDDDVWTAIEVFREVLRERDRAERTLRERAREMLGMETRFADIDDIVMELFGDIDVPAGVEDHIREAAEYVSSSREDRAREYLAEEFGSDCDFESPDLHPVGDAGRTSLCHRHRQEFEDPGDAMAEPESR